MSAQLAKMTARAAMVNAVDTRYSAASSAADGDISCNDDCTAEARSSRGPALRSLFSRLTRPRAIMLEGACWCKAKSAQIMRTSKQHLCRQTADWKFHHLKVMQLPAVAKRQHCTCVLALQPLPAAAADRRKAVRRTHRGAKNRRRQHTWRYRRQGGKQCFKASSPDMRPASGQLQAHLQA